ncbi:MAG: hypothetical protein WKF89_04270 [Chitinophagaceae bacterium]
MHSQLEALCALPCAIRGYPTTVEQLGTSCPTGKAFDSVHLIEPVGTLAPVRALAPVTVSFTSALPPSSKSLQ